MSYTIEQMRAWEPVLHKWVEYVKINRAGEDIPNKYVECQKRVRAARREDFPGVYCAWNDEMLAYIGYSKNVIKRVNWYRFSDFPDCGDLHFTGLRCATPEEAAALEADLIELHKPVQNFRREPKGGQVRAFTNRKRSRYGIANYYGGR